MADEHPSLWKFIPPEILAHVFSFLPVRERFIAASVCRDWAATVAASSVWHFSEISFEDQLPEESHATFLKFLQFIEHIRYFKIVFEQARGVNRRNVCDLLDVMARKKCRLQALCIVCSGTSPFYYSGQDVLQSIRRLFECMDKTELRYLDFRQMPFVIDNKTVGLMTEQSPNLHTFLINNHAPGLIMLRPETVVEAVRICPKLSTLGVAYVGLSVDLFKELLRRRRGSFWYLDLFYDGMTCCIPNELWTAMVERHPQFRVGLEFAPVIPARKMVHVLSPFIPVAALRFNNFACMVDQVRLTARFYSQTLEVLEVFASASPDLNLALIELAERCVNLKEVHCYCVVTSEVVNAFLQHCPNLKKYTLTSVRWLYGSPPTVYL